MGKKFHEPQSNENGHEKPHSQPLWLLPHFYYHPLSVKSCNEQNFFIPVSGKSGKLDHSVWETDTKY